jgi:hypothetical protein
VILTEAWLGAPGRLQVRLARVLSFPLACAVHCLGGSIGAVRLSTGHPAIGKTERGQST